ncbi:MAG: aldose 1-epimerase [Mycobacterium leprae]
MNKASINETTWSGVPALRLSGCGAHEWSALLVPSLGGNLISLVVDGRELLRTPPDAEAVRAKPARWGIPILLPPNRIAKGRFRFNDREYQLEINSGDNHSHGFILRRPCAVAESRVDGDAAAVTITFRAADYPEVMAQFPHPFIFTITYRLNGERLHCTTQIANEGSEPMPFGLGFHHYLAAPDDGTNRYLIRLTPAQKWEISPDLLPTGRFTTPEGPLDLSTWQPLHAVRRDGGYRLTTREADGWSRFELKDQTTGQLLTMRAGPEYGHWVIFNGTPGFEGFICPEPYTCMTNAFNLDLPGEVSGMAVVAPGEHRPAGEWELIWS